MIYGIMVALGYGLFLGFVGSQWLLNHATIKTLEWMRDYGIKTHSPDFTEGMFEALDRIEHIASPLARLIKPRKAA